MSGYIVVLESAVRVGGGPPPEMVVVACRRCELPKSAADWSEHIKVVKVKVLLPTMKSKLEGLGFKIRRSN